MSAVVWAVARAARSLPAQASHTGRVMNPGLRRCVDLSPLAHTHTHRFTSSACTLFFLSSRVIIMSSATSRPIHCTQQQDHQTLSATVAQQYVPAVTQRGHGQACPVCAHAGSIPPAGLSSAPLMLAQCERAGAGTSNSASCHTTLCAALLLVRGTPLCESKAWPCVACFVDRVVANAATLLSAVALIHSSEDIVAQCGCVG